MLTEKEGKEMSPRLLNVISSDFQARLADACLLYLDLKYP
jgi:hypothetical protein